MRFSSTVTIAASAIVLARPQLINPAANPAVLTVDCRLIDDVIRPRLRKKLDRFAQLALLATDQLKSQFANVERERVGVFIGNDLAGWNYVHAQLEELIETRNPTAVDPYVATAWFPAAAQGEITIESGIRGQSKTFSAGFLSGGLALECAARQVEGKSVDIAIAGGVEAPNAPVVLRVLELEGRISPSHPAAEAVGLLALCASEGRGQTRMTISSPRRSVEAALDDIVFQLEGANKVSFKPPSVNCCNAGWSQILSGMVDLLRNRFGSRLNSTNSEALGMDVGSASFPLAVIDGSESSCKRNSGVGYR